MRLGYKSETGATVLSIAFVASFPFLPIRIAAAFTPFFLLLSRYIARGARCRIRPPSENSSEKAKAGASFLFSESMPANAVPVCLVTGTNSGIGFHTAVGLAAEGYEVVITCRNDALTKETAKKIESAAQKLRISNRRKYANSPRKVRVVGKLGIECDNFDSIRTFCKWFSKEYENRNFQVLVNNAGMMRQELKFSSFNPSLELHTAVNFLGPMLLTELLLPMLEKNAGRVVYVSSEAHRFPQSTLEKGMFGMWKKRDPHKAEGLVNGKLLSALQALNQGKDHCSGPLCASSTRKAFVRYGTSKLLNTYHAHHIARRYRHQPEKSRVYACSLHPGCVVTGFQRDLILSRFWDLIFSYGSLLYLKSSEEGAQTSLHCAMCPKSSLELVSPIDSASEMAISPYFVECAEKTKASLLGYGWDLDEGEKIVAWGKKIVGI